ncbi:MAG TPA: type I polyketide synthase, partial [Pseudonocardia sp.]|nr:type I polyketide synthase [Pseudonocardia sp.]
MGAVKSNIGHTQAASGVAGVIKMVQAMRHRTLPRTLHADAPSTLVDWSTGRVELLTGSIPWPAREGPRRAGVSAFGVSGTNAHVILEERAADAAPEPGGAAAAVLPWVISARTTEALAAQAGRLAAFVEARPQLRPADVGISLATTRTAFDCRAVVLGGNREELLHGTRALATGAVAAEVVTGAAGGGRTAVLFPGQGAQRPGMGRELHAAFPVFASAFDEVLARLDEHLDRPLRDVMWGRDPDLLAQTVHAQASLFALEVALFRLLGSWGVAPDFLIGHSVGEIAAAHVGGVLSLADATALVAARGRLMQAQPTGGAMVAVAATEDEVRPLLVDHADRVGLAAVNGPSALVISGDEDAVVDIAETVAGWGRKTSRLRVSHAFHSPRMDPVLAEFAAVAQRLTYSPPGVEIVSNLTGGPADPAELCSPGYWVRHVREAVRFADGIGHLVRAGATRFVEAGPTGVLCAMVADCLGPTAAGGVVVVPVLRPQRSEVGSAVTALARLHVHGAPIDWPPLFGGARRVALPTYAFQRERHWLETTPPRPVTSAGQERFWDAVDSADPAAVGELIGVQPDAPLAAALPALSDWVRTQRQ